MQLLALGSFPTSSYTALHPLPHVSSLVSLLLKDHPTNAKEKTVWSNDEWSNHALHQSHCWAKEKNISLPIHIASNATVRTQDMTAATTHTCALADIAGALTIATINVLLPTSLAPLPNALSHSTTSMWALFVPPPSLLGTTSMSLASLLETMTEILKGTSLTESHGSASLGGASCYDPQTCRAPIFFYFPRTLFPY